MIKISVIKEQLGRLRAAKNPFERIGLIFLLPGELVCDWLNVKESESRFLLRMFVNLGVYGKIGVFLILPFV